MLPMLMFFLEMLEVFHQKRFERFSKGREAQRSLRAWWYSCRSLPLVVVYVLRVCVRAIDLSVPAVDPSSGRGFDPSQQQVSVSCAARRRWLPWSLFW